MSFPLFCLFFFATILLCLTLLNIGKSRRSEEGIDTSNRAGLAVTAAIILGWTLLQSATSATFFPFKEFSLGLYPFLIAAASLSMYLIYSGKIRRFWIYLFVTSLSVVFIPENIFVFGGVEPLFLDRFMAAFFWAAFISAYTRMDKLNGLTLVQTSALCLGFILFPLVNQAPYSSNFSFYPMIILAALIAFIHYKKRVPEVVLGKTGSAPLGYLMGLFFVLLAIKGYWMAYLIMPAYCYFEIVYSVINKWIHRHNPEPNSFLFFTSWVIRKNLNVKGLFPSLFVIMSFFAFIGIVFNQDISSMLIFTGIWTFCSFYKLLNWGKPKITYRGMFSMGKEAIQQVSANVKDSYKTVSTYVKDKKKK